LSDPIAARRFREIVPPPLDDAYSLAKWLSQSPTDAEDIVQDAALRALRALSSASVVTCWRGASLSREALHSRETQMSANLFQ
jgi:DNA-directed RNA polymerase specialized sigma24 family protein